MKQILFLFVCMLFALSGFSQVYTVGNGDGHSNSCTGVIPLPIELLGFNAKCNNGTVEIIWSTATQINNDYFSIVRTIDAINFQVIGTVDGAGNSSKKMDYSFIDIKPTTGTSYYLLKQTDFDGKFEYFDAVAVTCNVNNFHNIIIYPNPNKGHFIIQGFGQNADLIVISSVGETVLTTKINSDYAEIDLGNKQGGVYFINVNSGNERVIKKVIVK
jgi:hypothetical protein